MSTLAPAPKSPKALKNHKVVTQEKWLEARKTLLAREKELTRRMDELSAARRELPWVKIEKSYVFSAPEGKVSLADLFAGRSQLIVQHFMFDPDWQEGCPSCSFMADHWNGTLPHLAARDVSVAVVSRAPLEKLAAFKKRMGWQFPWVSSYGSSFNTDFHVSFSREELAQGEIEYNYSKMEVDSTELPGMSVFYKDATGSVYHTYSTFGRGVEVCMGTYNFLDLAPKGRDEDHFRFPMEWVRYHDCYGTNKFADADQPYWPENDIHVEPSCGCSH